MKQHAVVIGGGIGGLLAAHALAARFDRVTVLERDRYPRDLGSNAPPARRGAPQGRCLHLLLASGAAVFDELVPGWRTEAVTHGALPFDARADAALFLPDGWLPRTYSGVTIYACSRALLEHALRRRLSEKPGVTVQEGDRVVRLLCADGGKRVLGVLTASSDRRRVAAVTADMVVDASGRGSTLPAWISCTPGRGRPSVEETVVRTARHYVSRWFHLPEGAAPEWRFSAIAPGAGRGSRAAMMLAAEGNRWCVVLLAPGGTPLPSDDADFLEFTGELGDGEMRSVLERGRPISPILRYGRSYSRLRYYERVDDWPSGLVALGDSVCALDPYYGLGMTNAARGVALLAAYLDHGGEDHTCGRDFQEELAGLIAPAWALTTGRDGDGIRLPGGRHPPQRPARSFRQNDPEPRSHMALPHLLGPVPGASELART